MTQCICSSTPNCQTPSAIFNVDFTITYASVHNYSVTYEIPGSFLACSKISSLLLSNLEYLYSDSIYYQYLINSIRQSYIWNTENPSWFDPNPLIYNSTLNNFDRNSSISTIIKKLMVEQWNPSYSYETFYELCSPNYCFHEERMYSNNIFNVFIILLSMIGGLIISLRVITPYLVSSVSRLFWMITKKQEQQTTDDELVHLNWFDRLKLIKGNISRFLYDVCININIFPSRTFGNNINQMSVNHLGKQTTRLFFVLLMISFLLMGIYTLTKEQILTKTFDKPSFDTYEQLEQKYGDKLTCSCSSIETTYNQVINIDIFFHSICSSEFISDEVINLLAISIPSNLSTYATRDYRHFIYPHIFYLKELCHISIESVRNLIEHFLSTSFITNELLFEHDFNQRIDATIAQTKSNAPNSLNSIMSFIRNVNFGNAIISTYGTNFKYVLILSNHSSAPPTEAEIYDNDCSCALRSNCTSQAYRIGNTSSDRIALKGLKIGCTPSESFLSSTLECFYDVLCIDIIKEYLNYSDVLHPISIIADNRTVEELAKNLFIEQWLITKNYSSYYQQCLPLSCSYTYVQESNLIYILSFILGLQGGLILVLKWICPQLVLWIIKIKRYRNKHLNTIAPNPIENIVHVPPRFSNIISTCTVFMVLIIVLVVFSIYIVRTDNNNIHQQTNMSTTIETTTTTTSSYYSSTTTTGQNMCKSKFERILTFAPPINSMLSIMHIADFNNDNKLDIGMEVGLTYDYDYDYYNDDTFSVNNSEIYVLPGNENGTFDLPIISSMNYVDYASSLRFVNMNDDDILDCISVDYILGVMYIFLGNGNGTFEQSTSIYLDYNVISPIIQTAHFNDDGYMDFALTDFYLPGFILYFGNANGSYRKQSIDCCSNAGYVRNGLLLTDFNNDDVIDVALLYPTNRTIIVFFGFGNGSFDVGKSSFLGGGYTANRIAVGDFNEDKILDIVINYNHAPALGLLFGYANGTFGARTRLIYTYGELLSTTPPIVDDFNRDGHLDIVISTFPVTLAFFYGDGNGLFETYTIILTETFTLGVLMNIANLNIILQSTNTIIIFNNTGQCDNVTQVYSPPIHSSN